MLQADASATVTALFGHADNAAITSAAAALNAKGDIAGDAEKIKSAAKEFESIFIAQMLQQMFPEEDEGFFGDPYGEDVYRDWLIDQYGKLITDSGGIGVADHVQRELLKLQEVAG